MTIPYYLEGTRWRVAHLDEIVADMVERQDEWYDRAAAMLGGAPPTTVVFSPFIFKLAYCYDRAYGTMSWGNWLRLPMEFQWSEHLDDGQLVLKSHPWFGAQAMMDVGIAVAMNMPGALSQRPISV